MTNARTGKQLPPPEPGGFGGAVLNSYMWGFWLAVAYGLMWLLEADLREDGSGYLPAALGIHSSAWAKFWAVVMLTLVATSPVGRAAREYHRFTGRNFLDDRIGFAKAGGQDIGMFSGLVAVTVCVLVFACAVPAFVVSWIRVPLLVVASVVCGNLLAGPVSRRALSVLFGRPLRA